VLARGTTDIRDVVVGATVEAGATVAAAGATVMPATSAEVMATVDSRGAAMPQTASMAEVDSAVPVASTAEVASTVEVGSTEAAVSTEVDAGKRSFTRSTTAGSEVLSAVSFCHFVYGGIVIHDFRTKIFPNKDLRGDNYHREEILARIENDTQICCEEAALVCAF